MTANIVTDALTMAWFRRKPTAGLIHHSDRDSQYASYAFQNKLKEYGMICSVSRKGNCWDNAPVESWFNSFKNERSVLQPKTAVSLRCSRSSSNIPHQIKNPQVFT